MKLKKNQTIVFFGDSITEGHKTNIESVSGYDTLGTGFVNLVHSYIMVNYPHLNLRIINQGISGHRSIDLLNRIQKDCLDYNPDWVVMMIGTNDAWRQVDSPHVPKYMMKPNEFKDNCRKLIELIVGNNTKLLLLSPFMIESNHENKLKTLINGYVDDMENLATEYQLPFVNINNTFDDVLKDLVHQQLSKDQIHPNIAGHMIIAEKIIKYFTSN